MTFVGRLPKFQQVLRLVTNLQHGQKGKMILCKKVRKTRKNHPKPCGIGWFFGTPEGTRTPDLLIRRHFLLKFETFPKVLTGVYPKSPAKSELATRENSGELFQNATNLQQRSIHKIVENRRFSYVALSSSPMVSCFHITKETR